LVWERNELYIFEGDWGFSGPVVGKMGAKRAGKHCLIGLEAESAEGKVVRAMS
jgi:hypothetical protein